MQAWMRSRAVEAVVLAALVAGTGAASRAGDEPEKSKPVKEVKLQTEDGLVLAADLYEPAGGGEGKPSVVALHAEGGERSTWKDTAALFQAHGFSVLAIDLRGHGANKAPPGATASPGDAGVDLSAKIAARDPETFGALWKDVAAGVKYLRATLLADGAKVAVVGCGACGAAGLEAASRDAKVAAALWIGPATNNFGVAAMEALRKWDGRPIGLLTTQTSGHTDFDNIGRMLAKQQRFEAVVVPGPAAAAGEVVAKGDGAVAEVVQFVRGWIERPKFTGKTHVEDNSAPGKIVAAQSMDSSSWAAGGLLYTGNEAPPQMDGMLFLASPDPKATKLPAGARRIVVKPAKGPEPCVELTIDQWSGSGWSKVESRTVVGCGSILLGKELNTWELWLSPRMLGVKPFSTLCVARAKLVKGKPNWSGGLTTLTFGKLDAGESKTDPSNPSTWEEKTLR